MSNTKWALTLTLLWSIGFHVGAASLHKYRGLNINDRNVYSIEQFPYKEYLVCVRQREGSSGLSDYMQSDTLLKNSLRQVAGETAAQFYRYFKELPAKENIRTEKANTGAFPKKQQTPFYSENERYTYSWRYLSNHTRPYHYTLATNDIGKENFGKGRHWAIVLIDIFQRSGDYQVEQLTDVGQQHVLLSLNLREIAKASSEQAAYQLGFKQAQLLFYRFPADKCE